MQERVVGIETEYALIYYPERRARGGSQPVTRPENLSLYLRFETALRARIRSLPNAFSPLRAKLGRFLENGGTFHYEATVEHFEHGLIEMASPECRDPLTLVTHERAKDELAEELAADVREQLRRSGDGGHVRLGKNNVDSQSHTFGSHESYWVEDPLSIGAKAALAAPWALLWLATAPVIALIVGIQLAMLVALALFIVFLITATLWLPLIRRPFARRWLRGVRRALARLQSSQLDLARRLQPLLIPLHAAIAAHGAVYGWFHFRAVRKHMTAFLATRAIYAGAGGIHFDGGPLLHVSQRAPFIETVTRICVDGRRRPIFEMRDLFFRPITPFLARRRLQLMLGDANLCEWALLLRVGATCLVIEAIETGRRHPWPSLADPLTALREVGADPSLARELPLRDGSRATAIEIQRRYLDAVRILLPEASQATPWKRRVLDTWDETLDLLSRDPDALADRVDWIAKRSLLRAEIPEAGDWRALEQHGAALLRSAAPDDVEEGRLRDLAYRAWRTDLRYHELGPRGGYRRLERRGRIRRLSDPARVAAARRMPPHDTRARARGEAIRWGADHAASGGAAWHRVRLGKRDWRWFHDPLDPGPPGGGTP
jgi:proteasome accessory factor A